MAPKPSGSTDVFNVDKIRELVELMKEHDLSVLDVRQGDQKVRLRRGAAPLMPAMAMPQMMAPAVMASSAPAAAAGAPPAAASAAADGPHIKYIKSPMVGTFYLKPKPDAKAFVSVGDHVGPETVCCIVEAMKVFNEIPAEISGQIVAILVESEEPVDFGRPLFKVDTSK